MVVCFGLMALTLILGQSKGPRTAAWIGWAIALVLAPAWMIKWVGPLSLDPRMSAAMVGIFLIATSGVPLKFRINLMDLFFVGFFFTVIASQQSNNDLTAGTICVFVRRWVFPYAIGRILLSTRGDLEKLTPILAKFLLICSCMAIVEAITQRNWMNFALGKSFYILDQTSEGFRWGIKRAHGCTEHPIYFGLMLVMLFPFAIEAGRSAFRKAMPRWLLLSPLLTFAAIVVTVSRGAQIASVICLAIQFFFRSPKLRVLLIILAIGLGLGKDVVQDKAMEVLSKAAGEKEDDETWVLINGKEYLYTGTRHRMLLFTAYEQGIENTGMLGYGTALKDVPVYEDARLRFNSIDCHYLVLLLQHGWCGIFVFCGMLGVSIVYSGLAAWRKTEWCAPVCGAMCGAMIAVGVLMFSVFFHPHYGSVFMFACGFLANVHQLRKDPEEAAKEKLAAKNEGMLDAESNWNVDSESLPSRFQTKKKGRRIRPGHAPIRQ